MLKSYTFLDDGSVRTRTETYCHVRPTSLAKGAERVFWQDAQGPLRVLRPWDRFILRIKMGIVFVHAAPSVTDTT